MKGLAACIGMLIFILDGKTALSGAATGVELCLHTVIPSLFPFLMLSSVVMETGSSFGLLRPLGRLFRIPRGAEAILVPSLLGGYPVGARAVGDAYAAGQLSSEEAQRLLAYCNNAGPGFIFGMAGALFPRPVFAWTLWAVHLAGALMTAWLLPGPVGTVHSAPKKAERPLPEILSSSIKVMALICGWVVLFRVVLAFLGRWLFWALPIPVQVLLSGLLELTNGCCLLPVVEDVRLRFALCAAMLALGGLCVAMQTVSVTRGLPLRYFFLGKVMQAVFSLGLCLGGAWALAALFLSLLLLFLFRQKRSSISRAIGV